MESLLRAGETLRRSFSPLGGAGLVSIGVTVNSVPDDPRELGQMLLAAILVSPRALEDCFEVLNRRPSLEGLAALGGPQSRTIPNYLLNARHNHSQFDINSAAAGTRFSLLHSAATCGAVEALSTLLRWGANASALERTGSTALHLAARNGHRNAFRLLLQSGVSCAHANSDGLTALHWVATNGHTPLVRMLLDAGAPADPVDLHGQTPLLVACQNGHTETVKLLVVRGANVNAVDKHGRTAAFFACRYGQVACLALLLLHGVDVCGSIEESGESPLSLAVKGQFKEAVRALVAHAPKLVGKMPEVVVMQSIEEAAVVRMSKWLALEGHADPLLAALSDAAVSHGMQIVSVNTNLAALSAPFGRLMRAIAAVLEEPPSAAAAPAYAAAQQQLESLWTLTATWFDCIGEPSEAAAELLACLSDRLVCLLNGLFLISKSSDAGRHRFRSFVVYYLSTMLCIVDRDPPLIFTSLQFLLDEDELRRPFFHVVRRQPFLRRREWFFDNLAQRAGEDALTAPVDHDFYISAAHDDVMRSSCDAVLAAPVLELQRQFSVRFVNESGQGAGVRREWIDLVTLQLISKDYGLFVRSADGSCIYPNARYGPCGDADEGDALATLEFCGRVFALALYHRVVVDARLARPLIRHIIGVPVDVHDIEMLDPDMYRSLIWLLETDISDLSLEMFFALSEDRLGRIDIVDLAPGGRHRAVTEANKHDYVQRLVAHKLVASVKPRIDAFLKGFFDIVPQHAVSLFSEDELALMLSGTSSIDVDDWRAHTEYSGFEADDEAVAWFWAAVEEMSQEDRAMLLRFVTGSPRAPLGGFVNLAGAQGDTARFTIVKLDTDARHLPSASVCFNSLKLPKYESKEQLSSALQRAVDFGRRGFELS